MKCPDIGLVDDFLKIRTKALATKRDKWQASRQQNFCIAKEAIKRTKSFSFPVKAENRPMVICRLVSVTNLQEM